MGGHIHHYTILHVSVTYIYIYIYDLRNLGGWGLGVALPPQLETAELALRHLGRGVPKHEELTSCVSKVVGTTSLYTDVAIPDDWTNGTVKWFDLLARAHSYPCHIHLYEGCCCCCCCLLLLAGDGRAPPTDGWATVSSCSRTELASNRGPTAMASRLTGTSVGYRPLSKQCACGSRLVLGHR